MLKRLSIKNFKRFDAVEIDLSPAVVFIGQNNSGKTSALQALALWDAGCKQWLAKRASAGKKDAAKAVTIGRKDLVYLPLPASNALWKDLRVREGFREDDKTKTKSILIEIVAEGEDEEGAWACGFEFEYVSEEFFYCRPLRLDQSEKPQRMPVPAQKVENIRLAFLPPMSGLLMEEPLLQEGRVGVLLGSGRSGEVLRNLCYSVAEMQDGSWESIVADMYSLFGIKLGAPAFIRQLGTVEVDYADAMDVRLPLISAGLGMQQTLLLLTYLYRNRNSVLLLDEPDAHLEILRQRQTYQKLTEVARKNGCQIVCASHSEVVLNEAVSRDTVVAFIGKPHVVSGSAQVMKALRDFGFEHYLQAELTGWVLYVEGSTDLAALQAWARLLKHAAADALAKPYVHYLNTNLPSLAHQHFAAVKEANGDLLGFALFDKLEKDFQGAQAGLSQYRWGRREIENYFATPSVLRRFARGEETPNDLFKVGESESRLRAMDATMDEIEQAVRTLGEDLWSPERKASEHVLPQIFSRYHGKTSDIRVPAKNAYAQLIEYQLPEEVDAEVIEVLNEIDRIAKCSKRYES